MNLNLNLNILRFHKKKELLYLEEVYLFIFDLPTSILYILYEHNNKERLTPKV